MRPWAPACFAAASNPVAVVEGADLPESHVVGGREVVAEEVLEHHRDIPAHVA